LCKRKADGYYTKNGAFSLDQVNAEISRLQKLKISLQVMQTEMQQVPPKYPKANPTEPTPTLADSNTALGAAYQALYDAQGVLNAANPPTDAQKTEVQNKQRDLATALETWENTAQNWVKYELSRGGEYDATCVTRFLRFVVNWGYSAFPRSSRKLSKYSFALIIPYVRSTS
jgi:hypothetical protein